MPHAKWSPLGSPFRRGVWLGLPAKVKRFLMSDPVFTTSKFLSLVLRHHPETIKIVLDSQGWVAVDELLEKLALHGKRVNRELLNRVVLENDKQRFAFSDDGRRIRASQGHSLKVDLGLPPASPPEFLFHGTPLQFIEPIRQQGLLKGQRQHVHLSADIATATKVGARRGKPIILHVKSGEMCRAGFTFFLSANGVWLTDNVPPQYLIFPAD